MAKSVKDLSDIVPCSSTNSFSVQELSETLPIQDRENSIIDNNNCDVCDDFLDKFPNNAEESAEELAALALVELHDKCEQLKKQSEESHECLEETRELESLHRGFKKKNKEISHVIKSKKSFTLIHLLKTDDDLKIFTGIDFNLLKNLSEAYVLCVEQIKHTMIYQ